MTSQQTSCNPAPRPNPRIWLLWPCCAVPAAVLYLATMAPGLLWGDSGNAQIRVLLGMLVDSYEIARAHVTYFAAAIALDRLLPGEAAYWANAVAALAGAVTVANVGWLTSLMVRSRLAIACSAGGLLFSHTLWQLSTGAEVVTFSTMCLSFELVALVRYAQTRRLQWLMALGFANGFGWSTHNFAILMWPAYVVFCLSRRSTRAGPHERRFGAIEARALAAFSLAWLIGCLPLVVLVVREYHLLGSVAAVAESLLTGRFAPNVFNVAVPASMALRTAGYVLYNFPTPLLFFAPLGWWHSRRSLPAGIWWTLTVAGLTYFLFAARYRVADQYTFLVHSYLFLAVFAAIGVDHFLQSRDTRAWRIILALSACIAPFVYLAAVPVVRRLPADALPLPRRSIPYRQEAEWFLTPWRNGYDGAERFARQALALVPPDSVIILDDTMRRPIDYLQMHESLRPDVFVPGTDYVQPRQGTDPIEPDLARRAIERSLLFTGTDVYHYLPRWMKPTDLRFVPVGPLYRVEPGPAK